MIFPADLDLQCHCVFMVSAPLVLKSLPQKLKDHKSVRLFFSLQFIPLTVFLKLLLKSRCSAVCSEEQKTDTVVGEAAA